MKKMIPIDENTKDFYIKDEGDFVFVIAQTDKAKQVVANDEALQKSCKESGQDPERFGYPTQQVTNILTYAISHDCSVDSEVPMKVPEKPKGE